MQSLLVLAASSRGAANLRAEFRRAPHLYPGPRGFRRCPPRQQRPGNHAQESLGCLSARSAGLWAISAGPSPDVPTEEGGPVQLYEQLRWSVVLGPRCAQMHLPPRATAHAHRRPISVDGQQLSREARARVEAAQVPGRELVPSRRNRNLCFDAVVRDESCCNAYHSLHPRLRKLIFLSCSLVCDHGKVGKGLLPKASSMRHRSIREGALESPLRGTFVISAGSSKAQLTAVIRD